MRHRIGRPRFGQGPASARGEINPQAAVDIPFVPTGGISSTNVQDAIVELDQEKGPRIAVGDLPPSSPELGQLWWESDTGYMFIWYNNGGIPQWVPVVTTPVLPALRTPTLDLVTDPDDNTPEFTLTGDLREDDIVRFQFGTAADFTSGSLLSNTIDASENIASSITFVTGALADGTWYFRGRVERTNYPPSAWSNTETITIATTPPISPEVEQFLERTTGLEALYTDAYTALIDGLVADGIWAKIDALYIFATKDRTTAKLNIKSSSYTATEGGPPAFVKDKGFKMSPWPAYVDTGLNAYPGDKLYKQDDAHLSVWTYMDEGYSYGGLIGTMSTEYYPRQYILPNYGLSNYAYFRINTNGGLAAPVTSVVGFTLANRSSANDVQGYWNGDQIASGTDTSVPIKNNNFSFTDQAVADEFAWISGGSIGGSLTQTEAEDYYTHLRAFMTAVGVP